MDLVNVYIDAGHGAQGNPGNESAFCIDEQDFTLSLAEDLAARLPALGPFAVKLSRQGEERKDYADRITEAKDWGADAFVSLHSDVRGPGYAWKQVRGRDCYRNEGHGGFAILWSDETPDAALVASRKDLAQRLAVEMINHGFSAYDGADYPGLYDTTSPGVFVDRHDPEKRIRVLRRPAMPSVIIETHQAWDVGEAVAWNLPETRAVFAAAVARALAPAPAR